MAAFQPNVVLPVVTKLFSGIDTLSFVQRCIEGRIVISEGSNLISVFEANCAHPLKCWSFKQKHTLTCPVVFDFHSKCFVSAHSSNHVRLWTEKDNKLESVRRGLVEEVLCLLSISASEPVVVYQSGCFQVLSAALEGGKPHHLDLEQHQYIKWIDGELFESRLHVLFILENECTKQLTFCRKVVSPGRKKPIISFNEELVKDDEYLISWCLNHTNLHFYTLWSDRQLCMSFRDHSGLSKVCTLSLGESMPFAIAALDETQLVVASHSNSGMEADIMLEIWDTKFAIRKAITYLDYKECSRNPLVTALDNNVYVQFENKILSISVLVPPSSLASVLGKANFATDPSPEDWHKKRFRWKTSGIAAVNPQRDKGEKLISELFPDSEKTLSRIWQENITWLIDKGDIQTIFKIIDSFPNVPESTLVDILAFVLGIPEEDVTHVKNPVMEAPSKESPKSSRASMINCLLSVPYTDVFLLPQLQKLPHNSLLHLLQYLHRLLKTCPLFEDKLFKPTLEQIVDWISLILDAHVSNLGSSSQGVRELLEEINGTVVMRCEAFKDLDDIASLLHKVEMCPSFESGPGLYCIEYIEL